MHRALGAAAAIVLTALAVSTAGCGGSAAAGAPPTTAHPLTSDRPAAVTQAGAKQAEVYERVLRRYLSTPAENSFPQAFKTVYVACLGATWLTYVLQDQPGVGWRVTGTTGSMAISLKSARSAAGVRYITPHGVRRTCASLLAALDVHPRVAMRILRHSKIAVTMEIYTEVPDQAAREALRRLGEQFDS